MNHDNASAPVAGGSQNVQHGKCGTCGEEIRQDALTGTTCACARRSPALPDPTPLHQQVRRIEFVDGPSGNPGIWDHNYGQRIELSATYHGDRDEFWLVLRDGEGNEVERRRAATVDRIVWMEPQP